MIDHPRNKVALRCEQDLLDLIDAVQDDGLRQDLKKLYFHPARANVGVMADVLRLIITQAHERGGDHYRHMNVYTDRDTMADVLLRRDSEAAGGDGEPPSGLEAAKISMMAMQAEPPVLPNATVPDEMVQYGYAIDGNENDYMAAVPGHERPKAVARKMLQTLDAVKYARPGARERTAANAYTDEIKKSLAYFRSLKTGNEAEPVPANVDPEDALRLFLLAERVRSVRPLIQERVDSLEREAQDAMDDDVRARCIAEAASLRRVYGSYDDHTQGFVNLCSYLPQTGLQIARADQAMDDFYDSIYNAVPRGIFDSEGSWKGGLRCTLPEVADCSPTLQEQMNANATILRLLKSQPSREA